MRTIKLMSLFQMAKSLIDKMIKISKKP
jgi:hypothetical protein